MFLNFTFKKLAFLKIKVLDFTFPVYTLTKFILRCTVKCSTETRCHLSCAGDAQITNPMVPQGQGNMPRRGPPTQQGKYRLPRVTGVWFPTHESWQGFRPPWRYEKTSFLKFQMKRVLSFAQGQGPSLSWSRRTHRVSLFPSSKAQVEKKFVSIRAQSSVVCSAFNGSEVQLRWAQPTRVFSGTHLNYQHFGHNGHRH